MPSIQTTLETMRASIHAHDLLKHPFYLAWSAGTLPVSALTTYAREYGAFIAILDRGWETLGEAEGAEIERNHADLWNDFARALGTDRAIEPSVAAVKSLVAEAKKSFSKASTAAGALYAFELQQPATAQSKLEGLDAHYASLSADARPYFRAHAGESGEDVILEHEIAIMTDDEKSECIAACDRMSKALWNALTEIHATA